jgi:probable HAF family extracellular repeat protein
MWHNFDEAAPIGSFISGLIQNTARRNGRRGGYMKARVCTLVTEVLAILTLSISSTAQGQWQPEHPTRYIVKNLGTLRGALGTAFGINNQGWITGTSNLTGDQHEHAFLWYRDRMLDLGTAGGPNSVSGFPLKNERGLIPVISQTAVSDPLGKNWNFTCDAYETVLCDGTDLINVGLLWYPGGKATMPTLGGNNSQALGANNLVEGVGFAETANQGENCVAPQVLDYEAVISTPLENRIEALPPYPGDTVSGAIGINDRGQAVGASGACAPISPSIGAHALLWENGKFTYLGTLGGQLSNVAYGINNRGQVVGLSDLPGEVTAHAFIWQNGSMTDLGTLPGDFFSVAFSINERGQVIGESCDVNFNCRPFLWQKGMMSDLNTLIPSNSSLYLLFANDLNDEGEIVDQAIDEANGTAPAFLVVPCDGEPANDEDCQASARSQMDIGRLKIVLPATLREHLRRTPVFGP